MKKLKVYFKTNGIGFSIFFYDYGFDIVFLCFYIVYSDMEIGHFGDMEEIKWKD